MKKKVLFFRLLFKAGHDVLAVIVVVVVAGYELRISHQKRDKKNK